SVPTCDDTVSINGVNDGRVLVIVEPNDAFGQVLCTGDPTPGFIPQCEGNSSFIVQVGSSATTATVTSFDPETPTLTGKSGYALNASGNGTITYYVHGSSAPTGAIPSSVSLYNPSLTLNPDSFYRVTDPSQFAPPVLPGTYYLMAEAQASDGSVCHWNDACNSPKAKSIVVDYPSIAPFGPNPPSVPAKTSMTVPVTANASKIWFYIKKGTAPVPGSTTVNPTTYNADLSMDTTSLYKIGGVLPESGTP